MNKIFLAFLFSLQISLVFSSVGDRSPFYGNCVKKCVAKTCEKDKYTFISSTLKELSVWSRLLWNCRDECRYNCMWLTVEAFKERGYQIPKFHGKWPFIRIFGVQEPGSVFASFLNLAAHAYMLREIRRRFSRKSTPMATFWHIFALVCMHSWLWSIIFHTRDTPFTEFMDYACAFSMVMALFVAAIVRVLYPRRKLAICLVTPLLVFLASHVVYLGTADVDYTYNMVINVAFGAAGSVLWAWWGRRARSPHLGRFVAWSAAALALELLEFAPFAASWDAHALWHLATAPLPLIFYRFVIEDLNHLQSSKLGDKTDVKLT